MDKEEEHIEPPLRLYRNQSDHHMQSRPTQFLGNLIPKNSISAVRTSNRARLGTVGCESNYNKETQIFFPIRRVQSLPNIKLLNIAANHNHNIFPDLSPRSLRIAEVKSWKCPWEKRNCKSRVGPPTEKNEASMDLCAPTPEEVALEQAIQETSVALSTETTNMIDSKHEAKQRPSLRLKLEDMPTVQEAEERSQRAALRLIARREANCEGKGSLNSRPKSPSILFSQYTSSTPEHATSTTNSFKINIDKISNMNKKGSILDGSGSNEESNERLSSGGSSKWSPNHGMFTTTTVSISEAGISSPDSSYLHLQEDLIRVEEIGRGATGTVYKAIHVPTLKLVAIKEIPVYGKGTRRQMVRELHALYSNLVPMVETPTAPRTDKTTSNADYNGKSARKKPSPYIVSFYDAFVEKSKNCVCLVLEYMGVGSLQDIVLSGGIKNEVILARITSQILKGLEYIHNQRMVHRDIKPHNLLMNNRGDVKISDFGLARTLTDNHSSTKTFVGTLLYMAPERIGGGDYSYAADIWSFGLSIVAVAIGKYPLPTHDGFFGLVDSVSNEECLKLPDHFSPEFRDLINLCLRIDPNDRPTAAELVRHSFFNKYLKDDYLSEWRNFVKNCGFCIDPLEEIPDLADAIYEHTYHNILKNSHQSQSDYGKSMFSSTPTVMRKIMDILPIERSLQLGLAQSLDIPPTPVYKNFDEKWCKYNDKLLEEQCFFSPQSWTASPGFCRKQEMFGGKEKIEETEGKISTSLIGEKYLNPSSSTAKKDVSVWRKLQNQYTILEYLSK